MKYKDLYKYRSVWMGIAILWIFFFHIGIDIEFVPLKFIHNLGYGGCDIFLFASGIGIYYSLNKNDDLGTYFTKRIMRLMPMLWVVMLFWIPYRFYINQMTWQAAIGNIFGIQYFIDWRYDYNWYIPVILLCYVIAPFLKKIIDKRGDVLTKVAVMVLLIIMSFAWSDDVMMMTGMTRIAIFFMGMIFGQLGCLEKPIKKGAIIAWIVLIPIGLGLVYYSNTYMGWNGWSTGLNWLPLLISTPGMCILMSLIAMRINDNKAGAFLNKMMSKAGEHSLEIYFGHVTVVVVFRDYMIKENANLDTWVNWVYVILISVAATVLLYLVDKALNMITGGKRG